MAALIWLGIALAATVSQPNLRASLVKILHLFFQPVILFPLLAMFGYIASEVWIGSHVGLWNRDLLKGTLIWTVGSALVLSFKADRLATDPSSLRKVLGGVVGVAVLVEFFMNLFVMRLLAELILQPVAACLAIGIAVSETREDLRRARGVLEGLLAVLGVTLLTFTVHQLYLNWSQLDHSQLIRELLLPVWLTIGLLLFLFLLGLYVSYQRPVRIINRETSERIARWRARLALLTTFHVRVASLRRFGVYWCKQLAEAPTLTAARRVVQEFQEQEEAEIQAVQDEEQRLQRYAGVEGNDEHGQRLDRREFKETVEALRWLQTCQMGWYRRRGGRYRPDLLKIFGPDFARRGLPQEHGINLEVAEDGQSWFAWRRTVTGWCFAIGAARPPPDQWEFDGPDPPDGFPGDDPAWGDGPFSDQANRNWEQW